jgi:hypothetical protein
MSSNAWIVRALNEVASLSENIVGDLDEVQGGIGWWSGHELTAETRCGLSDYLIDAVRGIDKHLSMADFYLQEYTRKRSSADFLLRGRMRKNGGDPVGRGTDIPDDEHSNLQLQSYVYAFFNAASSVLDTLAGTVIGVAGLDLPLVKADLAKFAPFSMDADYPSRQIRVGKSLHPEPAARGLQLALVHSFRTSLISSGPEGWHVWLDHKRNQLAHRGGRLQLMAFPRRGRGPDTDRFLLLDRDPDLTTLQGFQNNPSTMESMYLLEDELTTMSGILKSINTTVIGTIVAARSLWEDRRETPLLLPQPATQWHQPQKASRFEGYQPIPDLFKTVTAAIISPTDATRLKSSRALNNRQ